MGGNGEAGGVTTRRVHGRLWGSLIKVVECTDGQGEV